RNCCSLLCRFRWLSAPRPSPAEWTYPATIQLRIVVPLRSATGDAVLSQRPVQLDFPLPCAIPAQCVPARQLDHVTPHCRHLPSATSPTPTVVGADDVGRAMLANVGTIPRCHSSPTGRLGEGGDLSLVFTSSSCSVRSTAITASRGSATYLPRGGGVGRAGGRQSAGPQGRVTCLRSEEHTSEL